MQSGSRPEGELPQVTAKMTTSRGVLRRAMSGRADHANVQDSRKLQSPEAPLDIADQRRPRQPEAVQSTVHADHQATDLALTTRALAHARRHRMPVDADEDGKVDNPQTRKTQPSAAKAPRAYLRTETANVDPQLETKLRPDRVYNLPEFKGTSFTTDGNDRECSTSPSRQKEARSAIC